MTKTETSTNDTERIGCQRCGEDKPTTVYEGGTQQANLCGECADRVDEILGGNGRMAGVEE